MNHKDKKSQKPTTENKHRKVDMITQSQQTKPRRFPIKTRLNIVQTITNSNL